MEIIIRRQVGTIMSEVFIVRRPSKYSPGDRTFFHNFDESGRVIVRELNTGEYQNIDVKPAMVLPENELRDFLAAFAEAAKERGDIKEDTYLKGKLEGTENHLSDLRTLLKLK